VGKLRFQKGRMGNRQSEGRILAPGGETRQKLRFRLGGVVCVSGWRLELQIEPFHSIVVGAKEKKRPYPYEERGGKTFRRITMGEGVHDYR